MRGEYTYYTVFTMNQKELPPRARRIQIMWWPQDAESGTTSACAENTSSAPPALASARNYLRVRGEYAWHLGRGSYPGELPPRARRIPDDFGKGFLFTGTTSACAENTMRCWGLRRQWRNYLRVRGEYITCWRTATSFGELPPRARRILLAVFYLHIENGTTSACAENTLNELGLL